jgi:predicted small metal-binding protein
MKHLRCREAGFNCDHEIQAETVDEVLEQAAKHVQSDHNLKVTPPMVDRARMSIFYKVNIPAS